MRLPLLALGFVLAAAFPATASDLTGAVVEAIDAGIYTYIRLDTSSGEQWAAVPKSKLDKGAKVHVLGSVKMKDFESKTLKRTFPSILFGSLDSAGGAQIKVAKAAGQDARTVAELYALRDALKGKEVTIRGKVVKVTSAVMDLNWIHLRDGTGDAKSADNDLTATTTEALSIGQVVTLRGRITLGKDLGGRYKFPVLLEDAKIVP